MNPSYRQVRFLTSAARPDQGPPDEGFEVAFAGRSNAGLKTLIGRPLVGSGSTGEKSHLAITGVHRIYGLMSLNEYKDLFGSIL
jgi:hypothetical protein